MGPSLVLYLMSFGKIILLIPALSIIVVALVIFLAVIVYTYFLTVNFFTKGEFAFKNVFDQYINLIGWVDDDIIHPIFVKLIALRSASYKSTKHPVSEFRLKFLQWLVDIFELFRYSKSILVNPSFLIFFILVLNLIYILIVISIPLRLLFLLY